MEAEFIALAAVGGSKAAGFQIGTIGGVPPLPGFDLPFPRIDLVGITLDTVGPGGRAGTAEPHQIRQSEFLAQHRQSQ